MNEDDIYIRLERIGSPGGQHVGVPPAIVVVTHRPTGMEARVHYGGGGGFRSQHKARTCALQMIEWGLSELGWEEE